VIAAWIFFGIGARRIRRSMPRAPRYSCISSIMVSVLGPGEVFALAAQTVGSTLDDVLGELIGVDRRHAGVCGKRQERLFGHVLEHPLEQPVEPGRPDDRPRYAGAADELLGSSFRREYGMRCMCCGPTIEI
jgi:hypothetical protein